MGGYIEWTDEYSVGVARFDSEHQRLMGLADRMVNAVQQGTADQEVDGILEDLIDYALTHFEHEERLMEETGYPGLREHREAHDRLIRRIMRFKAAAKSNSLNAVEVAEFLLDWVLTHIKEEDMGYGPHLNAHGIT